MYKDNFYEFYEKLNIFINNQAVNSMKNYIQHGNITTYQHCLNVARTSYIINRMLKLNANENDLITTAMLHDFYLYDWHNNHIVKLHGISHSETAANNAKRIFDVNAKVY